MATVPVRRADPKDQGETLPQALEVAEPIRSAVTSDLEWIRQIPVGKSLRVGQSRFEKQLCGW